MMAEFDKARKKLLELDNDKLIENYLQQNFNYADQTAFSIGYKNSEPYLFSTIFRRDWWPDDCYRILNRTWKLNRQDHVSKKIDVVFREMVESQIKWLNKNTNVVTTFISREHNSRNTLINVRNNLNMGEFEFTLLKERIRVSEGPEEQACQDILYAGSDKVFKKWPTLNV